MIMKSYKFLYAGYWRDQFWMGELETPRGTATLDNTSRRKMQGVVRGEADEEEEGPEETTDKMIESNKSKNVPGNGRQQGCSSGECGRAGRVEMDETAADMAWLGITAKSAYDGNKADQLKERLRELAERARGSGGLPLDKEDTGSSGRALHEGTTADKRSSAREAIAAFRRSSLTAPNLSGAETRSIGELGSFRIAGDHRHKLTVEKADFKNKQNVTSSFHSNSLECSCKKTTGGGTKE